jgi:hypothetical protein
MGNDTNTVSVNVIGAGTFCLNWTVTENGEIPIHDSNLLQALEDAVKRSIKITSAAIVAPDSDSPYQIIAHVAPLPSSIYGLYGLVDDYVSFDIE